MRLRFPPISLGSISPVMPRLQFLIMKLVEISVSLPDICGPDWFNQFQAAGIGFCNKSFLSSTSDNLPINMQQENSNEIGSFMPIRTINNLNTNIAVNAGAGSIISNNYLSNNDVGLSMTEEQNGCCIIDHNKLTDNRFFGVVIADGEHLISNTKIFGENVGVAAIATNANTVATLDHVKIVDAKIPVQALSSGGFTAAVNVLSPYFFVP